MRNLMEASGLREGRYAVKCEEVWEADGKYWGITEELVFLTVDRGDQLVNEFGAEWLTCQAFTDTWRDARCSRRGRNMRDVCGVNLYLCFQHAKQLYLDRGCTACARNAERHEAWRAQEDERERQRKERRKREHVYFIKSDKSGLIKIGFSANPEKRCADLRRELSDETLRIVTSQRGGRDLEKKLHQRFRRSREWGEWFLPSEDLLAYIEGLTQ